MIIAIDGPAGSGKSTVARQVADKLHFLYIDTGAMYRALTYAYLQEEIDFENPQNRKNFIQRMQVSFNNKNEITLNGNVIQDEIRSEAVNKAVSYVCAFPEIRQKMTFLQREMGKDNSVIMDGRDIGTTVFPNAEVKIFLVADITERAKRRQQDYLRKGIKKSIEEVLVEIEKRDLIDSTRELSPAIKAQDAIEIDTTHLTISQVADKILKIAEEAK